MKKIIIIGSLLSAVGCGDNIGPVDDTPATRSTEITMNVIPAADLAANGGSTHVGFVAYQDGDGPWQPMEDRGGFYSANIEASRFGVAVGCAPRLSQGSTIPVAFVSIQHATLAETTQLSDFVCVELMKPLRITGTASGLPSPRSVFILGTGAGSSNTSVRADGFSVNAYAALTDVIGYFNGGSPGTSKVARVSNVDPRQSLPISLDFAAAGATPVTYPVTVPADSPPVLVSAHVRNSSDGRLLHLWSLSNQREYSTLPRALLREGDLVRVGITRSQPGATQDSFVYLAEPGPASLELGPAFTAPAPMLAKGTNPRATFSIGTPAASLPVVSYQLSTSTRAADAIAWQSVTVTQDWLKSGGLTEYQLPDLSGLPGWNAMMALAATAPVKWEAARYEKSSTSYQANLRLRVGTASGEISSR
jgi:hypothetical protein